MSDTRQKLMDDIKSAMKAGDKPRLAALRLISADIKRREVDERVELDEQQVMEVLDRMMKQRRESIAQYRDAGRDDLLATEEAEAAIIQEYLPEALSDEEIDTIVAAAIADTGATSIKDMGKVMGKVKPAVQGRADMGAISAMIKSRLGA
ncbi:MAG: glutamyl-tRNA amidotransferase [Gammaproteobacteria bacterium]|nr:MAG: glutamyl-tRNA amidotransferase [Gammaproteobacteria bacterium]PIE36849.1 MAG: glutamyl-tRNA amidotransferase [Gammaproteobacteria bacterium]